jgi:hypothetical protein
MAIVVEVGRNSTGKSTLGYTKACLAETFILSEACGVENLEGNNT